MMNFQTSVKTCLTEKYATFSGRASRPEYWWFYLAVFIGGVIVSLLGIRMLYVVYVLAIIVPVTAAGWRRLQDTGRRGWYILIFFAVGAVSLIFDQTLPDAAPDGGGTGAGGLVTEAPTAFQVFVALGLGITQLVLGLLLLWWLTRPSQPETNAYGPPPKS